MLTMVGVQFGVEARGPIVLHAKHLLFAANAHASRVGVSVSHVKTSLHTRKQRRKFHNQCYYTKGQSS